MFIQLLNFSNYFNYSIVYCSNPQTYNVDRQVPDSAGTATAMFSGVKAQYKMLGLGFKSKYNTCNKEINEKSQLTTIATWAQDTGLDTGEFFLFFVVVLLFLLFVILTTIPSN